MKIINLIKVAALCAVILLIPLSLQPKASTAQSAPNLQNALNTYLQNISGVMESATIISFYSVAVPCPPGRACTYTPVVVLAAYSMGDAGGQALFTNDSNCPSCFTPLVAGGGLMSVAEIENYGIDATTAQALASNF
jgi:hypothetical protein